MGKSKFYKASREILHNWQKEHNLENVPCVVHHLRDTEEQRKYNDEHYKMWGHNLDGTFEYGKYVICCTKADHVKIHAAAEPGKYGHTISEENKQKSSERFKGKGNPQYGKRGELATCYGRCGELHPMYGKTHTEETKSKMSEASKKHNIAYRILFDAYHNNGGQLNLNKFKHAIKVGDITFTMQPISVYTK